MEPGRRSKANEPELRGIINQGIEEGLRFVLGESGLNMVTSAHPVDKLSSDPELFHEILTDIFKEAGALIIEREIARRLLESAGAEQRAAGRPSGSWLAKALLHPRATGSVSQKEKDALRGFVALPSLGLDRPAQDTTRAMGWRGDRRSIELTALEFAHAFRKGR